MKTIYPPRSAHPAYAYQSSVKNYFIDISNSTLTDSFKNEKSIRFTLSPEGNRIDFSDFSPWGWGIKSEKLVFLLNLLK